MDQASPTTTEGPNVWAEQLEDVTQAGAGSWLTRWRITNRGDSALLIRDIRMPHGRFKSAELSPEDGELPPGETFVFDLLVTSPEQPLGLVENAFLLIRASFGGTDWMVFVRVREAFDAGGMPRGTTSLITSQPVGFSGQPG